MKANDNPKPAPASITSQAKWGLSFVSHHDAMSINRNKYGITIAEYLYRLGTPVLKQKMTPTNMKMKLMPNK